MPLIINRLKDKSHRIISGANEKAFTKIQYPIMINILNIEGREGGVPNIIKS